MKKQIRLLIENIFNDIYDIDQENNLYIDIDDQLKYKYHPENYEALHKLVRDLIEERGPDANLNDIDTSNITDMSFLFDSCLNIKDIDISDWNIINVHNMEFMFGGCHNFIGSHLKNWDVSHVTNMSNMFNTCSKFTGKSIENWDVSHVFYMSKMFTQCKNLDCNLNEWDVSSVKNMYKMFSNCIKFKGDGLEFWKLNNLERAVRMFESCYNLSTDLSNWDISNIKSLRFMFYDCKSNILPDWYNKNFFED